jgi:hypothetical protein
MKPDLVADESQFIIGEDEGASFDGKSYVEEFSTSGAKVTAFTCQPVEPSELPYLRPISSALSSGSLSSYGSDGTLTDVIDSLEAVFTTSKWQSLVDLNGAAAREEVRSLGYAMA